MSLDRDCYLDDYRCYVCPEIDAVAAVPPTAYVSPNIGWNAGARSIQALDGNVHVAFTMSGDENGVILGFHDARDRRPPVAPSLITHGWYFFNLRGSYAVRYENGAQVGQPMAYDANSQFELRRVNGVVTYAVNGASVATSARRSDGPLRVMTCLYAAGDTAPGGTGSSASGADANFKGALTSGVAQTVSTNPSNPTFNNDWYWTIVVGAGATNLTVSLVDNGSGGFAADTGWVIVNKGAPLSSNDNLAGVATAQASPFNVSIDSPAAGTYYISLDADIAVDGLQLTATVT